MELEVEDDRLRRRQVADVQRARVMSAMYEVCAEHGAANATVARIVARSGISRRTFYELFQGADECFLAALDQAVARASERVLDAHDCRQPWVQRIRAALLALLAFMEEEPVVGRLLIVDTLGAGDEALARRAQVLVKVAAAVDAGNEERKTNQNVAPLIAEGLVGGVLAVIHKRMVDGEQPSLIELTGPLMALIVLPYLGAAAARRELERPVEAPKRAPKPIREPFSGLEMRLTYRTMRVLAAVAAQPGASNRQVGRAAGIEDQGQISKLLTRLKRLGMVESDNDGGKKGAPNVWTLTAKGQDVHHAIAGHAASSRA